jgi:hypothetical protein
LPAKVNQYLIFDNSSLSQDIDVKFGSFESDVHLYVIPMKGSSVKQPKMPSATHYSWHSSLERGGGTNKLRISTADKEYCTNCKYLVLLKSQVPTKVDFTLTRVSDSDVVEIIENKSISDMLKTNESQKYYYDVPYDDYKFTIDITTISGNIDFYYGKTLMLNDQNAIYKFPFQSNEEFFTVKFGPAKNLVKQWLGIPERRYMMVRAKKDSSYRMIVRRDNMLSTIDPKEIRHSSLGKEGSHWYVHRMDQDSYLDVEFTLKNILNMSFEILAKSMGQLGDVIHVYYCNSKDDYMKRDFSYQLPRLGLSVIRNKIYFKIPVRKGIAVIKISNIFDHPMFYSLLLNVDGKREMKTLTPQLGSVDQNQSQVYTFHSRTKGYLNIDFSNCLGTTQAHFAIKKDLLTEKDKDLNWKTLIDENMQLTKVHVGRNDLVYLKYTKLDPEGETRLNGPSVFSFMSYIRYIFLGQ